MEPTDELVEVAERANRLRRRCLARVLLSGILTLHIAPAAFFPPVPVPSAQGLLLVFGLFFAVSLLRWYKLCSALAGLEFSGWAFDMQATVQARPINGLDEHRPLPAWLLPDAAAPAGGALAAAADQAVAGHGPLMVRRSECIAAHGCVTVHDAANLIMAARGLARGRQAQS
jgi:hypothetical protein